MMGKESTFLYCGIKSKAILEEMNHFFLFFCFWATPNDSVWETTWDARNHTYISDVQDKCPSYRTFSLQPIINSSKKGIHYVLGSLTTFDFQKVCYAFFH